MKNLEQTVHNFADLLSWCDMQLANAYGVIEEEAGVERMAIKLFTKVIPRFEHCIHTNFGISEESCGGRNYHLWVLGKGMVLSGSENRDMSYFMFKALEWKVHGCRNIDWTTLE